MISTSIKTWKKFVNSLNYKGMWWFTFGFASSWYNYILYNTILYYRFCANSTTISYADNLLQLEKPGIGLTLIYMLVEGAVFFILTLFVQAS